MSGVATNDTGSRDVECSGAENAMTSGAGSWNRLHWELQPVTREATMTSCKRHVMLQRWEVVLVLVARDAGTGATGSYDGGRAHAAKTGCRAATGDRRRWCYKHEIVLL